MASATSPPSVIIFMADYGHDPTEVAVPFAAFKEAGFSVAFATDTGKSPECDRRMLTGWTQKLLGANQEALGLYKNMTASPEFQKPLSFNDPSFEASLPSYNLLFLPGGHDKAVRQLYDSALAQSLVGGYFQSAKKPSSQVVAAICHGVLLLAYAKIEEGKEHAGKSVLHDVRTTTLPGGLEGFAYNVTKLALGDYYKTYGAGSENTEVSVRNVLDDPATQWKSSLGLSPFVVHDEKYNYISGRIPVDAKLLASEAIKLVKEAQNPG